MEISSTIIMICGQRCRIIAQCCYVCYCWISIETRPLFGYDKGLCKMSIILWIDHQSSIYGRCDNLRSMDMIKKYVRWWFSSLVYLLEGILRTKNQLKHLQNPIISQILGNKSIFSPAMSQKPKTRSCFLPVRFDLELTSFLEICVCQKLWGSVLSNRRVLMQNLKARSPRTALASSWMSLQRLFYKIVYWKKCAFWLIRPIESVLFRWGLKEF